MTLSVYNNVRPSETEIKPLQIPTDFHSVSLREARLGIAIPDHYDSNIQFTLMMFTSDEQQTPMMIVSRPKVYECGDQSEMTDFSEEFSVLAAGNFGRLDFGNAADSPINGFNSTSLTATDERGSHIIRTICDDRLDRIIFLSYPNTSEGALTVSTLSIAP